MHPDSARVADGVVARYRLLWGGREVGDEVVRVERDGDFRKWSGKLTQREPIPTELSWTVSTDPATDRPLGFEVELSLVGETIRTRGWKDRTVYRHERRGLGGADASGTIGYGEGSALDLGSPLSGWWAWRLLAADLEPGAGADVRVVVVRAPGLEPRVELQRVVRGEGFLRFEGPGDEESALALGEGGWPERVVTRRPGWPRALVRERVAAAAPTGP